MKRSRYTPEQIAFALRQAENGTSVVEVCRKMGISEQTTDPEAQLPQAGGRGRTPGYLGSRRLRRCGSGRMRPDATRGWIGR